MNGLCRLWLKIRYKTYRPKPIDNLKVFVYVNIISIIIDIGIEDKIK